MHGKPSPHCGCPAHTPRRLQRGVSLVELMIATAVGLIVLAGATKLFVDHVQANRRALLEVRLHQDIRAATELMSRGLRRAGYWQAALEAGPVTDNPYGQIQLGSAAADQTVYSHSREVENGVVDPDELGGFQVDNGTLRMLLSGRWQALTDPAVVQVSRLAVTAEASAVPLGHLCVPACSAAQADCPRLQVRRYRISLTARSTTDPLLSRELHTTVRVRNDDLGTARCPSG